MVLGASVPETGGRDQYTYFQLFHIPQVMLRIKQVLEILSHSVQTVTQSYDLSCGVDHDTLQAKWVSGAGRYFFEAC